MIAFWQASEKTIKRIAVVGGAAVTICPATQVFGLSWTRDGLLIGQGGDRIVRCDASGGTPQTIVTAQDGEVIAGPQRLPGNDAVLFTAAPREVSGVGDRFEKGQVVVQSLDDGRRTVVVETGNGGRYLPSGHLVYVVGGVLFAAAFDPRAPTVVTGVPVIEGIRLTVDGAHVSVSETGTLLYVPGPTAAASSQRDLAVLNLKGGARPLRLPPRRTTIRACRPTEGASRSTVTPERWRTSTNATFSPDGQWVAYTVSAQETGTLTYLQPFPATGTRHAIGVGSHPVWSHDGTSLFSSPSPGQFRSISVTTKPSFATGEPVPVQRASLTSLTLAGGGNRAYDLGRNGTIVGLIETGINANTPASASQMQIVLHWFDELKQRLPME